MIIVAIQKFLNVIFYTQIWVYKCEFLNFSKMCFFVLFLLR